MSMNGDTPSSMIPTLQTLPPDDDITDHTLHNGLDEEGEEIYIDEDEEVEDDDEEEESTTGCYDNDNLR